MDRTVRILGVSMDLVAGRRGVDMGPSATRYGGLAGEQWGHSPAVSAETVVLVGLCGLDAIHVSLDLDLLDPTEAPGVGTTEAL